MSDLIPEILLAQEVVPFWGTKTTPEKWGQNPVYPLCCSYLGKIHVELLCRKNAVLWHNVACTTGWEACFAAQARLSNERLSTTAATTANHRPDEVTWALNHHFMNAWMDASADVCIDVYVHKYMCLYRRTSQTWPSTQVLIWLKYNIKRRHTCKHAEV